MTTTKLELDEDGWPVLLARAPGQVAAQNVSGAVVYRGAASGNQNFDPASGRFAGKQSGRTAATQGNDVVVTQRTANLPQGVTAEQVQRRRDIVRYAALQLKQLNPAAAMAFLKAHPVVAADKVNVDLFLQDVRAARMDYMSDILDTEMKTGVIKVSASKGQVKQFFNGMTDGEVVGLANRLLARGWTQGDLKKGMFSRITDKSRRSSIQGAIGITQPGQGRKKA